MAQEDYLSGSQFGQVAGSLLASKRKRDKKDFRRALCINITRIHTTYIRKYKDVLD